MPRFSSFRLVPTLVLLSFVAPALIAPDWARAAEGRDVPPLAVRGGDADGDADGNADVGAVGAGDATQNPGGAVTAPTLSLGTSSQVWATYKGDWQRSGASSAKLKTPLNLVWRHSTDASPGLITSSPLVAGAVGARRIYFAAGKRIYCIDAQDGTQLYRSDEFKGTIRAPLSLLSGGEGGGALLAVTTGGQIIALRPSDLKLRWDVDTRAAFQGVAPVIAETANGQRIIVGDPDGNLVAYDTNGQLDKDFSIKLGRTKTAIASTPVLSADGERIFVVARDMRLYAINLKEMTTEYSVPLRANTLSTPALLDDTLVVGVENRVMGFFTDGGQLKWQATLKDEKGASERVLASPSGANGLAFVGTVGRSFYAIDTEDGSVRWRVPLGASVSGTPLVLPNAVYVGTRNGMIYALKPDDGTILWRYRLHSERLVSVVQKERNNDRNNQQNNRNNTNRNTQTNRTDNPNDPNANKSEEPTIQLRTFGVSSAPAAVDGALYVIADNASLYSFSDISFDAEMPRALKAALRVRDTDGGTASLELVASRPVIVPGKAPISFQLDLDDVGSGIDPAAFQVTFDGRDVAPEDVAWDAAKGRLTVALAKADKKLIGKPIILPDSTYKIGVIARDYSGNILTDTRIFTVDKTAKPPAPTAPKTDAQLRREERKSNNEENRNNRNQNNNQNSMRR